MAQSGDSRGRWCAGEAWCPITATATTIGYKWHPVIVARLLDRGPLGFNALKDDIDRVHSKVLSDSLDDLERGGLVDRTMVSEKPYRVEYALTDAGRALEPVIEAMREWGERHLEAAGTG